MVMAFLFGIAVGMYIGVIVNAFEYEHKAKKAATCQTKAQRVRRSTRRAATHLKAGSQ